jgi:hypothetical protein
MTFMLGFYQYYQVDVDFTAYPNQPLRVTMRYFLLIVIYLIFMKDYHGLTKCWAFLRQNHRLLNGGPEIYTWILPKFLIVLATEIVLSFLIYTSNVDTPLLITYFTVALLVTYLSYLTN